MTHASYAEAIVETITQPLLVLDDQLSVERANAAFLRHFEMARDEVVGRRIDELGGGEWDDPELRRLLDAVLARNGRLEEFRVEQDFGSLGRRILLLDANRMGRAEAPDRILLAISDVTERERFLRELEGRREFGEKLIDSVREALLVLGWDLRVQQANQSFYERFAVAPEETQGRLVYELGNGQWDIPRLRELLETILPRETVFDDFEVEHDFEAIGRRTMLLNARKLDHLNLILVAIRDVTDERRSATRQQALVGELQHRVKNILGNVRALAAQTRRSSASLEAFHKAFDARLGALARTQDLIVRSPDEAVSLHRIVCLELQALGAEEGRQFSIEGPEVRLQPQTAQAAAMTLHELATNAAKYGALSVSAGRIAIAWSVERRGDGRRHLDFGWREQGVQLADREPKKGFGSRVIDHSLPHMLGGSVERRFEPDGLACRLSFPLSELRKAGDGG